MTGGSASDENGTITLRHAVIVGLAAIAFTFGNQLGYFASLSAPWSANTAWAVLSGLLSPGWKISANAYWLILGVMVLSLQPAFHSPHTLIAALRVRIARRDKTPVAIAWALVGTAFILWLFLGAMGLTIALGAGALFIGGALLTGIVMAKGQVWLLIVLALTIGLCSGLWRPRDELRFTCRNGTELTLRSGERFRCTALVKLSERDLILMDGRDSNMLVRLADIDPISLQSTIGPSHILLYPLRPRE